MNDYEKLCDILIEKSGGESQCQRFQERVELGSGGILARLYVVTPPLDHDCEDNDFGFPVIIRDISRSGMGLLATEEIDLDVSYSLKVVDLPLLKGSLIYRNVEPDGKLRYGFSLNEWLSDESHNKLSV